MAAQEEKFAQSDSHNKSSRPEKRSSTSRSSDQGDEEIARANKYQKLFSGLNSLQKDAEHSRIEELRLRNAVQDRDNRLLVLERERDILKNQARNTEKYDRKLRQSEEVMRDLRDDNHKLTQIRDKTAGDLRATEKLYDIACKDIANLRTEHTSEMVEINKKILDLERAQAEKQAEIERFRAAAMRGQKASEKLARLHKMSAEDEEAGSGPAGKKDSDLRRSAPEINKSRSSRKQRMAPPLSLVAFLMIVKKLLDKRGLGNANQLQSRAGLLPTSFPLKPPPSGAPRGPRQNASAERGILGETLQRPRPEVLQRLREGHFCNGYHLRGICDRADKERLHA